MPNRSSESTKSSVVRVGSPSPYPRAGGIRVKTLHTDHCAIAVDRTAQ